MQNVSMQPLFESRHYLIALELERSSNGFLQLIVAAVMHHDRRAYPMVHLGAPWWPLLPKLRLLLKGVIMGGPGGGTGARHNARGHHTREHVAAAAVPPHPPHTRARESRPQMPRL